MNNRCKIHVVLCLLITASVFFISCGIPTYEDFSDAIWATDSTDTDSLVTTLTITSNASTLDNGVGLVLFYYLSNNKDSTDSALKSKFDASYSGINEEPFDFDSEGCLIVKTDSVPPLAAFLNSDGTVVEANDYTKKLDINGSTPKKEFTIAWDSANHLTIDSTEIQRIKKGTKNFSSFSSENIDSVTGFTTTGSIYIHIFACFTASSSNFSNYFISDLQKIGSIQLQ